MVLAFELGLAQHQQLLRALLDGEVNATPARALASLELILVVLVVVVFTSMRAGELAGQPLTELAAATERLANGDYRAPRIIPSEYETWAAVTSLGEMELQLRHMRWALQTGVAQDEGAAVLDHPCAGGLGLRGARSGPSANSPA